MECDGAHVRIPGHRHADGAEAGFLEHVDQRAGGLRLPPGGLVVRRGAVSPRLDPHLVEVVAVAVEGVAKVPAGAHPGDGVGGQLEDSGRPRILLLLLLFLLLLLLFFPDRTVQAPASRSQETEGQKGGGIHYNIG